MEDVHSEDGISLLSVSVDSGGAEKRSDCDKGWRQRGQQGLVRFRVFRMQTRQKM